MQYYYTLLNAVWHCKVHRLVYLTSIQHVISSIQEICESDLVAFNFGLIEINKKIYFFVSSNINSIADGTDHRSLYKKPLSRLSGCVEENMSVLLHCQMSTNKQKKLPNCMLWLPNGQKHLNFKSRTSSCGGIQNKNKQNVDIFWTKKKIKWVQAELFWIFAKISISLLQRSLWVC